MKDLGSIYLLLINRIYMKLILKEFYIWKCKIDMMPRVIKTTFREQGRKRITHAHNPEKINKFKSMTERNITELLLEEPVSNIFEELKSSLQNKALKNEIGVGKEIRRSLGSIHQKNAMSSRGVLNTKGNQRYLVKPTPEIISNLAIVSSCSALNNRKDKNMFPFSYKK